MGLLSYAVNVTLPIVFTFELIFNCLPLQWEVWCQPVPWAALPCHRIGRSSVPLWSTLTNSSERDDKSKRKPMTSTTIWLWLQNNVFSPNRHLHVWVQFLVSGHRGELNICKHLRTFADQRDEGQWRHRWKLMIERNPRFRSITIAIGSNNKGQEPETAYDKRSMLRQYCVM